MEKTKKIKLFIGLSYLLIVSLFLYFFFSKFSLQEITSYDFLRNNRSYLIELKNSNLFLVSISFLFPTMLWVFPAESGVGCAQKAVRGPQSAQNHAIQP